MLFFVVLFYSLLLSLFLICSSGLGTIPMQAPELAVIELERYLITFSCFKYTLAAGCVQVVQ